jgi:trk system potassium uptake protein TrkA
MKVIIMGCGRVGEQLCRLLSAEGHQVTVIDPNAEALDRLGPEFKGRKIKGVGFDRDVLLQAGIAATDAFAAASASDNANILAARIARNIFSVPRVVARLYDPRRAEIYERLGLRTISSTTWGAERIVEMLVHTELDPLLSFGNGEVNVVGIEIPGHWSGRQVKQLMVPGEINVISVTRKGKAFIPIMGTELHADDLVHMVVSADAMERFNMMFGFGEGD